MEADGKQVRLTASEFTASTYANQVARFGFAIVSGAIPKVTVHALADAVAKLEDSDAIRRKRGVYGVRNLLDICPDARNLAASADVRRFVTPVLGDDCFAVRAVFFDKIEGANWSLGWHQDSVIAVHEKREADGFVGWSNKAGVWQVQPPAEVLAKMLAIRVHLDDCPATNGPLRVLPESHTYGWLDDEIDDWKAKTPEVICDVATSDIVAMRPLILHASAKSEQAGHRRVIHIEYAVDDLPENLEWHDRVYDFAE